MQFRKTELRGLRLLLIPAFAMALVACGGGTAGDDVLTTDPNGDVDGDGTPNFEDVDQTGGLDANSNGIDDAFENFTEGDVNGNGIADFEDVALTGGDDLNSNGIDDAFETDAGGPPIGTVCDGSTQTDTDSSTSPWGDNCQLSVNGSPDHVESSYTRGVQRMLNCLGHPVVDDADFGPNTESAVMAFQTENPPLAVDGIVGAQTWATLQGVLVSQIFDANFDAFSVDEYDPDGDGLDNRLVECVGLIQFYQNINDLSWSLATTPGGTEMGPFSTGF